MYSRRTVSHYELYYASLTNSQKSTFNRNVKLCLQFKHFLCNPLKPQQLISESMLGKQQASGKAETLICQHVTSINVVFVLGSFKVRSVRLYKCSTCPQLSHSRQHILVITQQVHVIL